MTTDSGIRNAGRFGRAVRRAAAWAGCLALVSLALTPVAAVPGDGKPAAVPAARAALTVTAVSPERVDWPRLLVANGNVAAWQEAVVGSEIGGFRLTAVNVNVGDKVSKGQVLARVSTETIEADLAQGRASVAEAKATLAGAEADAERARALQESGAISAQQINQYETAAETARARLEAARARVRSDRLRLAQTRVAAPDDGIISARNATVGSVVQNGQELFRLIRKGRLEWRAEVGAAELASIKPGSAVRITSAGAAPFSGRVRTVAPTVDPQTRNALVYVDLTEGSDARAGMFARGEFELGRSTGLALPQSAVLLRDGFSYVFRIGPDNRVARIKVDIGRRNGDRVEIVGGLEATARVVATGGGFLNDGDLVRVVEGADRKAASTLGAAR